MKLVMNQNRDSIVEFMAVHAVTQMSEDDKEKVIEQGHEQGYYDIKMSINGQEFDVEKFMNRWKEAVDFRVTEVAKKMVEERMGDRFRRIEEMFDHISGNIKESFEKELKDFESD